MRETTLAEMLAKKPRKVSSLLLKECFQKDLGKSMIKKLHVYAGPEHNIRLRNQKYYILGKEEITLANAKYYGTGRRKKSVARVYLVPGTGKITINKRDIDEYLGLETLKVVVRQPLVATETADKFDVIVNVSWWWIHRTGWSNPSRNLQSTA